MQREKEDELNKAFENYFKTTSDSSDLKKEYLKEEELMALEDTLDRIGVTPDGVLTVDGKIFANIILIDGDW